jgi:hypothetical protein
MMWDVKGTETSVLKDLHQGIRLCIRGSGGVLVDSLSKDQAIELARLLLSAAELGFDLMPAYDAYEAGVAAAREAIAAAKYDGERSGLEWSVRDVKVPPWGEP